MMKIPTHAKIDKSRMFASADAFLKQGEVLLTVIPPETEFVDSILRVRPNEDEQGGHCKRD